ncbi:Rop family plasmid primer RNA-binding protein, partial [Klebsiella pneumoniae]
SWTWIPRMCERLHEDAETLWQVMRDKLGEE